jgi:hypothetical protein
MKINSCPSHLYKPEVLQELKHHGLGLALGQSVVRRYAVMMNNYLIHGHSPKECAFDMHEEWKHEQQTYIKPDYLYTKACIGIHNMEN